MLLGLLHDTIGGCDHEDCSIGLGCTGDHVLDEVTVAGAVHDGKVELGSVEPLVGDIDGDTSLTLFLQVVHNPCKFKGSLTLGLGFLAVAFDDVCRYSAGLEHHPAHGGRLSVVDVADYGEVHVGLVRCHVIVSSKAGLCVNSSQFVRVLHI